MRFIHAADIHIDSPLRGLEAYEGAPVDEIRGATRRAFTALVDLAIQEQVAFLLIAGDVFDGDWRDYNTGLFFVNQVSRLREPDIPVFVIRGNHDAASQITRHLRLPDNVRELPTKEAGTHVLDDLGVAIHGQGFETREVTSDLSAQYPQPIDGYLNIGLLHTCLDGRDGHNPYAPCSIEGLVSKGYDYWALGHVHKREVVRRDPWVVFPGNLQGRHVRETGGKGCTIVDAADHRIQGVEHRDLDVVRWHVCSVDASEASTADDVLERVRAELNRASEDCPDQLLAARVVVLGASNAHVSLTRSRDRFINEVRALGNDLGPDRVWIESVSVRTQVPDASRPSDDEVLSGLLPAIRAVRRDKTAVASLISDLKPLRNKLPPELDPASLGVFSDDPKALDGLLDQAEQILLSRLLNR